MNKHIERAKQLRDTAPQNNNCAQTIMRAYAEEMGLTEEQAAAIGCNFGGGMKCGGTCGAITGALMVLGTKGVISPAAVGEFRRRMAQNHNGMTDCAELLKANAQQGGNKKTHCDNMIFEAIELLDEMTKK